LVIKQGYKNTIFYIPARLIKQILVIRDSILIIRKVGIKK